MKISEIKKKMHEWHDSMGFDISNDIDGAKTREDLANILRMHKEWLEHSCIEAQGSVEDFTRELGLHQL